MNKDSQVSQKSMNSPTRSLKTAKTETSTTASLSSYTSSKRDTANLSVSSRSVRSSSTRSKPKSKPAHIKKVTKPKPEPKPKMAPPSCPLLQFEIDDELSFGDDKDGEDFDFGRGGGGAKDNNDKKEETNATPAPQDATELVDEPIEVVLEKDCNARKQSGTESYTLNSS